MGCVFDKPKIVENKVFYIDVSNERTEKIIKQNHCPVLMKSFKVIFEEIQQKEPDSSVECTPRNYRAALSFIYINDNRDSNVNDKSRRDYNNIINELKGISRKISKDCFSSNLFESNNEQNLFSLKIIADINEARKNYKEYSCKILKLAENIEIDTDDSEPFLDFNCNNKNCRINLFNGISSFKDTADYIDKINGELEELVIIEDMKITFNNKTDHLDPKEVDKNTDFLMELAETKYEIIAFHFIYCKYFDDAVMSNMITLVDGDQYKDMRQNIFSKEVTHINVNTKKIGENKRVIYYVFAKLI